MYNSIGKIAHCECKLGYINATESNFGDPYLSGAYNNVWLRWIDSNHLQHMVLASKKDLAHIAKRGDCA